MNKKGPASLTSTLIVTKGNAAPTGLLAMNGNVSSTARNPDSVTGDGARKGSATRNNSQAQRPRLTLRLDPGRHLKIKLAAAHLNLNLQEIMIDALDRYLAEVIPSNLGVACNCLAEPIQVSAGAKYSSGA